MENFTINKKNQTNVWSIYEHQKYCSATIFLNCSPLKILLLIFHSRDFSAMWCEPTVIERLRISGS